MLATLSKVTDAKEAQKLVDTIVKRGLTYDSLEDWKDHYKTDPKLKSLSVELIGIHEDVFKRQKITHFDFE